MRQPALFIGHGAPVYARWPNPFTPAWPRAVDGRPTPEAVVVVSAHWYRPGLAVTVQDQPPTIHDFGGFAPEFYEITYPAPGAPWLADRIADLVTPWPVERSTDWGLDHGAWTVLLHLWPDASVPVVQLRLASDLSGADQIELGRRLRPLRDEGVAVLGSGNVVHNLGAMRPDLLTRADGEPAPWNERFDTHVADLLDRRDLDGLARWDEHPDARMANPTPEHLLPLLVVAGAAVDDDDLTTITEGPDAWSLSMRSVSFAPAA